LTRLARQFGSVFDQTSGYKSECSIAFVFPLLCALLASLGAVIAVNAVLPYTLILSPAAGLRVRTSFFGLATNRLIHLNYIKSFEFGYASHSLIPALRLELRNPRGRNQWIVVTKGTTEQEVNAFLQDIEA
jgi:hypothetical protein